MKIKRVKNKIGFIIWFFIGAGLVFLMAKIGASAETVQHSVPPVCSEVYYYSSSGYRQSRADRTGFYVPVQAGITYYSTRSFGFSSSLLPSKVDIVSMPFTPSEDGYLYWLTYSSNVCVTDSLVYYETNVSEKTLVDISVNKTKTTYFVGEEFTTNDISVDALYSDSSSENVINFTVDSSSVNINVAGTYQISVTYEGFTKTIPIVYESIPVTLTSISAVKSKTNYYVGDTLNTNDFVVTGIWSDGTETVLSDYTVNISAVHMNTVGSYPITVSYEDKTTTVYITVNAVEEPPVEPPLGDLTTTNALLQKLDIDINNNLYEVRLLCGFNVALLIASIFLRRKS